MLKLNRPLAFFDIESTGLDIINDKIIEISILKIDSDKKEKINTFRINPGIPIPPESSEIHGIFDRDVKKCPKFYELGEKIKSIINNCDLGGFNILKFDLPLLIEEFNNNNVKFSTKNLNIIDVQKIFHLMEKRNLTSAYKFYCKKHLKNSHNSFSDTMASYEVFIQQLKQYNLKEVTDLRGNRIGKITNDIDKISQVLNQNMIDFQGRLIKINGNAVFNFGKHKGKLVKEILKSNPEYYNWIIKGNFSKNTKDKLEEIKKKTFSKSNENS